MMKNLTSFATIIDNCYQLRSSYLKENNIEAYRLYNYEYEEWPVAIDIYKASAVIHYFEHITDEQQKEIEIELQNFLNIQDFFYKDRTKKTAGEPLNKSQTNKLGNGLQIGAQNGTQNKILTIQEYGHSFHINLSDYLDTGIFLDHRETRRWIEKQSKGKTILNTFAYTGSFTVYAAAGGTQQTYSVDLSKTYCEWLRKNLILNGFEDSSKHWVCRMDTFEFFEYAHRKKISFDIIIIDPPTFSRNKTSTTKQKNFSVQRDHIELITKATKLLRPDGFILFSNNNQEFYLDEWCWENLTVKILDLIPPDFPVNYKNKQIHQSYIIKR